MWVRTAIYFTYNLFLSTSAAVGATKLLGSTEWAATVGILAFIFVLMEIDGRMSARSIFGLAHRRNSRIQPLRDPRQSGAPLG
jgi:hypothetical protein